MKYIAFKESVAQMAASHIANHCILIQSKLQVELATPNAVQVLSPITPEDMLVIQPIIDRFGGEFTDELPTPVNWLNKFRDNMPRRTVFNAYDHEYARRRLERPVDPIPNPGSRRKDALAA